MCEPERGMPLRGAVTVAATAAAGVVVVRAVAAVVPFLVPAAAVVVALGAVSVPVLRWAARRACVPRWSSAYAPPVRRQWAARRAALTRGPLALEAPAIEVTPEMMIGKVKEEAR